MMKVVGIIGFKKSGKTTLGTGLARELSHMGYRVAVIKHVSEEIDLPDTDTTRYRPHADFVAAVSSKESEIILKGKNTFEDVFKYAEGDILLVEGFKNEKTYPRIACLRGKGEREDLLEGLELCTAGLKKGVADFDISNDDHIKEMARLVVERSFRLPDLDCGHCGFEHCRDLAREIVQGREGVAKCVSLNSPVSISVEGSELPLNPYNTKLFRNTILAMLSSLKGFKKGPIEIKIP
jgi:molybdopterin-guanine dinucleotide biosynthesis protein B